MGLYVTGKSRREKCNAKLGHIEKSLVQKSGVISKRQKVTKECMEDWKKASRRWNSQDLDWESVGEKLKECRLKMVRQHKIRQGPNRETNGLNE